MTIDLLSRGFGGFVALELILVAFSAAFAAFLCLVNDLFPIYYPMWGWCFIVMQVLVALSVVGRLLNRRRHRKP